jgi:putative ABC transport system permease protein
VVGLIVGEATVLNLVGAAVGTAAAFPAIYGLSRLPAVGGYIDGRIAWPTALLGFALAPAIGLAAAVYPALRGARIVPSEALRHE